MKKRGLTGSVYVALCQQFDAIRRVFLSGASVAAYSRTYLKEIVALADVGSDRIGFECKADLESGGFRAGKIVWIEVCAA